MAEELVRRARRVAAQRRSKSLRTWSGVGKLLKIHCSGRILIFKLDRLKREAEEKEMERLREQERIR